MKCLKKWVNKKDKLCRLFYICQDTWFKNIKEESFFNCLTWLHPALSGIIVSVLLGGNFLNSNEPHTSFILYSSCSKLPMIWQELTGSIFNNVFALSHIVVILFGFGTHIALFLSQRQLKKQVADGKMIITYNMDGVTISRSSQDIPSCHKLFRHNRTVVAPKASFLSFLLNFLIVMLLGNFFFFMGPSGPTIWQQFLVYTTHSIHFFLFNFIEAIYSPKLLNSLMDFCPCRRQYPVVNV